MIEEILKEIDDKIEAPFVTAKFGDHWKAHAKETYDNDTIISIAWKQGRRAILLEQKLRELLK